MIIEDLPDPTPLYCTTCMEPLTWVYVHHLKRNVAVIPLGEPDRFSFRIHTCAMKPERTWRHVQKVSAKTTKAGAAKVRAVLATQAKKRIEKEASS